MVCLQAQAWVSLCFLIARWSQGGTASYTVVHVSNAGPSKPGRLCTTFYDLPWEVT